MWICWCLIKWAFCRNAFAHTSQRKGFSPVWVLWWCRMKWKKSWITQYKNMTIFRRFFTENPLFFCIRNLFANSKKSIHELNELFSQNGHNKKKKKKIKRRELTVNELWYCFCSKNHDYKCYTDAPVSLCPANHSNHLYSENWGCYRSIHFAVAVVAAVPIHCPIEHSRVWWWNWQGNEWN